MKIGTDVGVLNIWDFEEKKLLYIMDHGSSEILKIDNTDEYIIVISKCRIMLYRRSDFCLCDEYRVEEDEIIVGLVKINKTIFKCFLSNLLYLEISEDNFPLLFNENNVSFYFEF